MTKLSIITINYNDKSGLSETVRSVLNQSFQDFEYILIDGGSSDGSKEVLLKNTDHFSYWISEPDRGIYHAMNKGLSKSHGEYILFLNSGDCLHSHTTLEEIFPLLGREDIIYGNSLDIDLTESKKEILKKYPDDLSFMFFYQSALRHQATFIKKTLFDRAGNFDESYKIVSDWIFMILAFTDFKATSKHVDLTVCNYKRGGISSSNLHLNNLERDRFLKEKYPFFINDYEKFKNLPLSNNKPKKLSLVSLVKVIIKGFLPHGIVRLVQKLKNGKN